MPRKKASAHFPFKVGVQPHRVWVGVRPGKKGVVYLRWTKPGKAGQRAWASLRFTLRDKTADELTKLAATAHAAALLKYEELSGERVADRGGKRTMLRLSDAWGVLTDPEKGRYAKDSLYRRDLDRTLRLTAQLFGADYPLHLFDRLALRKLVRWRAMQAIGRGHVGYRQAEIIGTRMITVLGTLKAEGLLPEHYIVPGGKEWKPELRTFIEQALDREIPPAHRPRYTSEEIARLFATAPRVDPRFALAIELGLELRPQQIGRTRRSNLSDTPLGLLLRVEGRGKKKGAVQLLGASQTAALEAAWTWESPLGYLAEQERLYRAHGTDYVLFPSEIQRPALKSRGKRMATGPEDPILTQRAIPGHTATIVRHHVEAWMREAERLAEVPHVDGRGWYGMRRQRTDEEADAGTGSAAVQQIFGWSSGRMGEEVYQDRERREAMLEARDRREAHRQKLKGTAPTASSTEPVR